MVIQREVTELDQPLERVYREAGLDFRKYNPGTVIWRLERRLQATGARSYRDYVALFDNHLEEYRNLIHELSISAGGFFCNCRAYRHINWLVLPGLVASKRQASKPQPKFWSEALSHTLIEKLERLDQEARI